MFTFDVSRLTLRHFTQTIQIILSHGAHPCQKSPSSAPAAPSLPGTCSAISSAIPELAESTIACMTSTRSGCARREMVAGRIAKALGAHPTIEATLDRRAALDGADYAISHVPGRRLQARHRDRLRDPQEVRPAPDHRRYARHRRDHARAAHHPGACWISAAIWKELCPDVTFLNYVNPMAMNTWAINRGSKIKTVGLCHSVQGTAEQLAQRHRRADRGDQLRRGGHQPHGLLPQVRAQETA